MQASFVFLSSNVVDTLLIILIAEYNFKNLHVLTKLYLRVSTDGFCLHMVG